MILISLVRSFVVSSEMDFISCVFLELEMRPISWVNFKMTLNFSVGRLMISMGLISTAHEVMRRLERFSEFNPEVLEDGLTVVRPLKVSADDDLHHVWFAPGHEVPSLWFEGRNVLWSVGDGLSIGHRNQDSYACKLFDKCPGPNQKIGLSLWIVVTYSKVFGMLSNRGFVNYVVVSMRNFISSLQPIIAMVDETVGVSMDGRLLMGSIVSQVCVCSGDFWAAYLLVNVAEFVLSLNFKAKTILCSTFEDGNGYVLIMFDGLSMRPVEVGDDEKSRRCEILFDERDGCFCQMKKGLYCSNLQEELYSAFLKVFEVEQFFAVCYVTGAVFSVQVGRIHDALLLKMVMTNMAGASLKMLVILAYRQWLISEQGLKAQTLVDVIYMLNLVMDTRNGPLFACYFDFTIVAVCSGHLIKCIAGQVCAWHEDAGVFVHLSQCLVFLRNCVRIIRVVQTEVSILMAGISEQLLEEGRAPYIAVRLMDFPFIFKGMLLLHFMTGLGSGLMPDGLSHRSVDGHVVVVIVGIFVPYGFVGNMEIWMIQVNLNDVVIVTTLDLAAIEALEKCKLRVGWCFMYNADDYGWFGPVMTLTEGSPMFRNENGCVVYSHNSVVIANSCIYYDTLVVMAMFVMKNAFGVNYLLRLWKYWPSELSESGHKGDGVWPPRGDPTSCEVREGIGKEHIVQQGMQKFGQDCFVIVLDGGPKVGSDGLLAILGYGPTGHFSIRAWQRSQFVGLN